MFCTICLLLCLIVSPAKLDQIVFPDDSISFQQQGTYPPPEPCESGQTFCGGDIKKYPVDTIRKIFNESIDLKISPETKQRFFIQDVMKNDFNTRAHDQLEPACQLRIENIPNFARAVNVLGKWVYLLQDLDRQQLKQDIKLVYCKDTESECKNDSDSPFGTGTTVCKQLHRAQKLLALDEQGELVVDTFKLPSACVCNYKSKFGLTVRGTAFSSSDTLPPTCNSLNATMPLDTPYFDTTHDDASSSSSSAGSGHNLLQLNFTSEIEPCEKEPLCDTNDPSYPEQLIEKMFKQHATFHSSDYFLKVFGAPCEPDLEEIKPANPVVEFRSGLEVNEEPLCGNARKYIFPRKARSLSGQWLYVINTKDYRQGVTVNVCLDFAEDSSCLYGGAEGIDPKATICKQLYIQHHMLSITASGKVSYEAFMIPSACVCHITNH